MCTGNFKTSLTGLFTFDLGNDQLGYIPDAGIRQATLPSLMVFATEGIFCLCTEDLMVYLGLPTDLHQPGFFFFFFLGLISTLL